MEAVFSSGHPILQFILKSCVQFGGCYILLEQSPLLFQNRVTYNLNDFQTRERAW